jgi:dihydrofolate reductase
MSALERLNNRPMRKVVAAINMTLDGYCDHTAGLSADEELHDHYADLLSNAGVILYGRTTYQLMQFWQTLLKNPYRSYFDILNFLTIS